MKQFIHLFAAILALSTSVDGQELTKKKVIILTGANNHNWRETTPVLEQILEASGEFSVDTVSDPEKLTPDLLTNYDVLLSNWNSYGKQKPAPWSEELKAAYVEFVKNGGGHVSVHAGSSSFDKWDAYQAIGLAGWKGKTRHKAIHVFEVRISNSDHPITAGLEPFKTRDELWIHPYVQPEATILAESFSKTTENWESTALVGHYGEGRCFTLLLGHDAITMQSDGFKALLLRGIGWAAHTKVK